MNPKFILATVIVALIAAFFVLDGQQYFNLQFLKAQKQGLNELFEAKPVTVSALYFAIYVLFTALALPAALILTLAGGAIFGFWHGLLLVSFASSIGATLAFLMTRYLFHDSIYARFGDKLEVVNKGIKNEGALYVFGLRLVPLFPFFMINSVLALTKLRTVTFYWASQLGMLAGTAVYVNAGTQLASLNDTSDILSLKLIVSFALLGIFPFVAKAALNLIKTKRFQGQP